MNRWRLALLIAGLFVVAVIANAADPPPSGGDYAVRRATIDSGGGASDAASYSLNGTIGQSDTQVLTGADFVLRGGFWTPSRSSDHLFENGFE